MPFHFRLHDPPCDVAFLSIVDGEALYNADHARTRDVKEATIRQMGWHRVDLPQDWFLSRQARDTTTHVLEAMQCTVQYLRHCAKTEEKRSQKAAAQLRRCEEERAAAFEELIELRETLALYKRQLRELGQPPRSSKTSPQRPGEATVADKAGGSAPGHLQCSFCANVYPSRHALESHFRKRHKRTEGYATMAAASAAVAAAQQRQDLPAPDPAQEASTARLPQRTSAGLPFMVDAVAAAAAQAVETRGDRGLREEVSELRLAVARLVEQQAELYRGLSPRSVAAVPLAAAADMPAGLARTTAAGALPGFPPRGGRATEEDILLRIQRELLHTGAELRQLQSAVEAENGSQGLDAAATSRHGDGRGAEAAGRHSSSSKSARARGGAAGPVAPRLNPQSFQRTPTGTDGSDGPVERRRPSVADSLVIVSPITPPAGGGARAQSRGAPAVPPISTSSLRGVLSGPGASSDTQRPGTVTGPTEGPYKRSGPTSTGMGPHHTGGSGGLDTAHLSSSGTARDSSSTGSRSIADFGTTVPGAARLPEAATGAAGDAVTPQGTPSFRPSSPSIGSLVLLPGGRRGAGGSAEASRRGSNGVGADRYGGPQSDEALSWTSGGLRESRPLLTAAVVGQHHPGGAVGLGTAAARLGAPTVTDATPSPNLTAAEISAYALHGAVSHGRGVAGAAAPPHSDDSLTSSEGTWASVHRPAARRVTAASAAAATPTATPVTTESLQAQSTERAEHHSDSHSGPREGTPPTTRLAPVPALQLSKTDSAVSGSPHRTAAAQDEHSKPPRSTSPFLGHSLQRTHTDVRGATAAAHVLDGGSADHPSRTAAPAGQPQAHSAQAPPQGSVPPPAVSSHALLPVPKVIPVVRLVPETLPSESGELSQHDPLNRQVTSAPHAAREALSASSLPPALGLEDSLVEAVTPPRQQVQRTLLSSSRDSSSGGSAEAGSRGDVVRQPPRNDTAVTESPASFSMNVPIFQPSDDYGEEGATRSAESEAEEPHSVPLDFSEDEASDGAAAARRRGRGLGGGDSVMEDLLTDDGPPSSGAVATDTQQRDGGTQLAVFGRPGSPSVVAWGGAAPAPGGGVAELLPSTLPEESGDVPSRAGTPDDASSLTGDYSYYTYSESGGEAAAGSDDVEAVEARHAAAEVAAVARGKQTLEVSPMTSVTEVRAAPVPRAAPVVLQVVTPLASVETQAAPAKGGGKGRDKKSHRGEEDAAASAAPAPQGSSTSSPQAQESAEEVPAIPRRNSSSLVPQKAVQKTKTLFSSLFKSKGESGRKEKK